MPRTDTNQTVDADGNIVEEVIVEVPINPVEPQKVKDSQRTLKQFHKQFTQPDLVTPRGNLSLDEARNWLVALTIHVRGTSGEKDTDNPDV